MPFNFQLVTTKRNAATLRDSIDAYEAALPSYGWPNWVLGNHDNPRIASRIGAAQARVAAMLLLTLRGTPTMYCGGEIGMHDAPIPPDRVQDPFEKNVPRIGLGRDPERTPMQWDSSPSAGFSSAAPWLPIAMDHASINVSAQREDPRSMLSLYRRLIELRRAEGALSVGSYQPVPIGDDLIAYVREHRGRRLLVVLNLSDSPQTFRSDMLRAGARILLTTHLDRESREAAQQVDLRADEGLIIGL